MRNKSLEIDRNKHGFDYDDNGEGNTFRVFGKSTGYCYADGFTVEEARDYIAFIK